MQNVIKFESHDIKSIISKILDSSINDVNITINPNPNNVGVIVYAPTELKYGEVLDRVCNLGSRCAPRKVNDHWFPFSVTVIADEDGVISGTRVILTDTHEEANEYVINRMLHLISLIEAGETSTIAYVTADYEKDPSDCMITWEANINGVTKRFSTHYIIDCPTAISDEQFRLQTEDKLIVEKE